MRRALSLLVITLLASVSAFANGIIGVWQQNPNNHDCYGDNDNIAYWQFTNDGKFYYEVSECGEVCLALKGNYTMPGNQLTLVVEEVTYQDPEASIIPVSVGMTTSINVSQTDNEIQFDINPFAEIDLKILDRVSDYPTFSPEAILPGIWEKCYTKCSGRLDHQDEYNAWRLNPDHTLSYAYEYKYNKEEHTTASGSWSISDNNLKLIFETSDHPDWVQPGEIEQPILICYPEMVLLNQREAAYKYALAVFVPTTDELIDKYFGGIDAPEADKGPCVTATGDGLRIENADGESVIVYTIDGRTVANFPTYDGKTILLPNGQYLVKVNRNVFKVSI